jgi:hypothetical protein
MQEGINFASPLGLQQQTILYPHEVFACIYKKYPATWQRSVVPSTHRLHQFWEETAEHPQMLGHPVSLRSDHREKCVPLAIHGDGVPITGIGKSWCKLATSFLWFSLLTTGSTTDMLFLIWAYFDQLISTGEISTLDEFFARLKWSFLQLWHGTWSDKDWQGQPCFWPSFSISFVFFEGCLGDIYFWEMPWRDILYDYFAYELISLFICSATQLVICIFERCFERDILVRFC